MTTVSKLPHMTKDSLHRIQSPYTIQGPYTENLYFNKSIGDPFEQSGYRNGNETIMYDLYSGVQSLVSIALTLV